jgi:hypothetical protein
VPRQPEAAGRLGDHFLRRDPFADDAYEIRDDR